MHEPYARLLALLAQVTDLTYAVSVLGWDQETMMPAGGASARADQIATLQSLAHRFFTDDEVGALLEQLTPWAQSLPPDSDEASVVRVRRRDFERLVRVPAGSFEFGEEPAEVVDLQEFHIGRSPITNAEYKNFLDANADYPVPYVDTAWAWPYNWDRDERTYPAGKGDHPVVLVSWEDALAFCRWAELRLPTEREWEKAARGVDGRRYPWGDGYEDQAAANLWGHGLGLAQYDPPVISRIWSLDHPVEIKEGMTFALETQHGKRFRYGVRIEEMLIVHKNEIEIVSNFPVKQITVVDPLQGYGDHVR